MLANRVREFTTTVGTGDITLGGALAGHVGFADAFDVGDSVIYVLEDGDNYEIGTGTLVDGTTLARTTVEETLVAGVLTKVGAAAIALSGGARVYCAASAAFLLRAEIAADVITEVTSGAGVTVDDVLIKDASISAPSASALGLGANAAADQLVLKVDGSIDLAGGYGSSGVTVSSAGAVQMAGSATVGGTPTGTAAGDLSINGWRTSADIGRVGTLGFYNVNDTSASVPFGKIEGYSTGTAGEGALRFYSKYAGVSVLGLTINEDTNATFKSSLSLRGTTLKAWAAGYTALQGSAYSGDLYQDAGSSRWMLSNAYYDGTWKRSSTGYATNITQTHNSINLQYAATGAANSSISWVNGLTFSAVDGSCTFTGVAQVQNAASTETTLAIDNIGTGDSAVRFRLGGLSKTIIGIDNSDGDKFKISPASFGTNDILVLDPSTLSATFGGNIITTNALFANSSNAGQQYITGGNAVNSGAIITLMGGSHATDPAKFRIQDGNTTTLQWTRATQAFNFQANDLITTGKITVDGGAKISIQNGIDGGSGQGLYLWDAANTTYGVYMSQSGASKSLNNGTAPSSLDGRTSYAIRNRILDNSTRSYIWENSSEACLMSLTADTGYLYTLGGFRSVGQTSIGTLTPNGSYKLTVEGASSGVVAGIALQDTVDSQNYGIYSGADDLIFRDITGALEIMRYDKASTMWNFQANALITTGKLTADGGAKISVQNKVDGGSGQGIFLWDTDDTTNGVYMAYPGSLKSLADATACADLAGRSGLMTRFRITNSASRAFVFENSAEIALLSLTADTGTLYTKGDAYTHYVYARNTLNEAKYSRLGHNGDNGVIQYTTGGGFIIQDTVLGSSLSFDSSQNATFVGKVTVGGLELSQPYIKRNSSNAQLQLSGGNATNDGGNIILNGSAYTSNPNDILFRSGSTEILQWDDSALAWNFGTNIIKGVNDLRRGSSTGSISVTGGTNPDLGANILMYGESHATQANDIRLRAGANDALNFDYSVNTWNFRNNTLTGVTQLRRGISNSTLRLCGGTTHELGMNLVLGGEDIDTLQFRQDTTNILSFAASVWNFESTNITGVGNITMMGMLNLGTATELTISSGAITITKSFHTVDTEADAASDDLTTINGGTDGDTLRLMSQASTRDVMITTGGNLKLAGGASFTLGTSNDVISFIRRGSWWCEESRSNNT